VQGRGGKGVLTAKITERRGGLVGAVVISPDDELFAITSNGELFGLREAVAQDPR
jgi:DNA gyrase subunit A